MRLIKNIGEFPKNIYDDIHNEASKYKTEEEMKNVMTYDQFLENFVEVINKMTKSSDEYYKTRSIIILYDRYKDKKSYNEIGKKCDITPGRVGMLVEKMIRRGARIIYSKSSIVPINNPITVDSSIERLDLSVRSFNGLYRKGVRTIGDLMNFSREDLLTIRNLGPNTVKEIEKSLNSHGFKLKNGNYELLEDYTWNEIDQIVKRGEHTKLFKIGDIKRIKLDDEIIIAQIADFNHDVKSDGTGKAGISFVIKNCMRKTHIMTSKKNDDCTWALSDMYNFLHTNVYNQLPYDLRSVIKPVDKNTNNISYGSISLETSSNKLWLLSESEIFDGPSCKNMTYSASGEGHQYRLFNDKCNITKRRNSIDESYWLRSNIKNYSDVFCLVSSFGSITYDFRSSDHGVVFGFCI